MKIVFYFKLNATGFKNMLTVPSSDRPEPPAINIRAPRGKTGEKVNSQVINEF